MAKVFNKMINIILILVIIVLVVFLLLRALNIINIYIVETGSMEDKIHSGDYVLLHRTDNYNVGDIVTYRVKNYYITHRIVKMEDGKITTRGDANNTEDDEVNSSQIEGKVIYYGGMLNFFITFKYAIAAFLVSLYMLNLYFADKEKKAKEFNKEEKEIKEN